MKVVVLYKPKSEHARLVEEFIDNFRRNEPDKKIELQDVDSRSGSAMATIYDVVQYPAVVATTDNGEPIQMWQGEMMPLVSEVAYYAQR